ncbi:hypothetical protein Bca52824_040870 [Brassica carinata]|uniref:Uncharacterized protein n=1 Tax=Brassica carinata TaxID=52824 RepID=A0A8X7UZI0_BRACI|nr:hypothetical protein Bca52824_040870 [Brassica carinata]
MTMRKAGITGNSVIPSSRIYTSNCTAKDRVVPPTAAACVSTAESEPVNEMKAGNVVEIRGFGFADELGNGTSGGASALMVLSHWEMLEEDPFFVPKTEEEMEEFGHQCRATQESVTR